MIYFKGISQITIKVPHNRSYGQDLPNKNLTWYSAHTLYTTLI